MEALFKNNQIQILPTISKFRYENIFNVYKFANFNKEFYYYNITNKLQLPEKIDKVFLNSITFDSTIPLTIASYRIYGNQFLWYLLYTLNTNTSKPRFFVEAGEEIIYIKPEFLDTIISRLNG